MPFAKYELIHDDARKLLDGSDAHQRDRDLIVQGIAEAVGEGGTAFSLICEAEVGGEFTPVGGASVSDFDFPPRQGNAARRQSFTVPVPAGLKFRLRVDPVSLASPVIRVWVIEV